MSRPQDDIMSMQASELAALHAAGALTSAEQEQMERRLQSGDRALAAEIARARPVMEMLLEAEPIAPGRHLRERIEARIVAEDEEREELFGDAQREQESRGQRSMRSGGKDDFQGFVILRAAEAKWRPTGLRGVRYRLLAADRRSNRRTIMLLMEPGSALPDHDHAGLEEVYVVSGDLKIGEELLGPGDYFKVSAGAVHGTPVSPSGCVAIVVSDYVPFPATSMFGFVWTAIKALFGKGG